MTGDAIGVGCWGGGELDLCQIGKPSVYTAKMKAHKSAEGLLLSQEADSPD